METSNESWIETACQWLQLPESEIASGRATAEPISQAIVSQAISSAEPQEVAQLVDVLIASFDQLTVVTSRLRLVMQMLAARVLLSLSEADDEEQESLRDQPLVSPSALTELYQRLSEVDGQAAAHALQMLAAQPDEESIDLLAGLLDESPPEDWKQVALGLSPLWNADSEKLAFFFERLDSDHLHPSTLSILIDLAGHATRSGKLAEHPWHGCQADLASLLSNVCQRLYALEREPAKFGSDVSEVQRVLNDSVSLTISLCDALGLVGNELESSPALRQAMQLSHRRIQAEAAGALARIGADEGRRRLVELAGDPVARLRAVSYAEELGCAELIDEDLRLPAALAEAELVSWLASAEQYGFAPQHVELIDTRTQFWPSYEAPRDCYLFRYEYELPTGPVSNIGIAGPATHAFTVDLSHLPLDDVYAIFAGWQVEHEDIFEIPMTGLNVAQRREADRLIESLAALQLQVEEPVALAFFLGEVALLAIVESDRGRRCAVTDGFETLHLAINSSPTSLTPAIVLALYRGRKLLRTFNP